jgi:hypothetical protein
MKREPSFSVAAKDSDVSCDEGENVGMKQSEEGIQGLLFSADVESGTNTPEGRLLRRTILYVVSDIIGIPLASSPAKPIIRGNWHARYLYYPRLSEVQPTQLVVRGRSVVHPFTLS